MKRHNLLFNLACAIFFIWAAASLGYEMRHYPELSMLAILSGLIIVVTLPLHLILSFVPRWKAWRGFFLRAIALGLILLLGVATYLTTNTYYWKRDHDESHRYVAMIEGELDRFHQMNGHYPAALGEISGLPSPPDGLIYWRERDSDSYDFQYYADIYNSETGAWFDDE